MNSIRVGVGVGVGDCVGVGVGIGIGVGVGIGVSEFSSSSHVSSEDELDWFDNCDVFFFDAGDCFVVVFVTNPRLSFLA